MCGLALVLTACGSGAGEAGNTDTAADDSGAANTADAPGKQSASKDNGFANKRAKRSYALGMDIGSSIGGLGMELDVDALLQGVRDTLSGADPRLTQQQMQVTLKNLLADVQAAQRKKATRQARANLEASKAFLAENADDEGVKMTASGLQYKVLEKGDGPQPDINDSVTVHYTGKLIDGTVFDSSRKRGHPATFAVDAVIPGWTEALQMMHEGAKYKLFIPPKLAYGASGAGATIGPNQALVFVVELIEVNENKGEGSAGKG